MPELFDVFWPDEVEEWCDVAEALEVERQMQAIRAAQFSTAVDPDGEAAANRMKVITELDDYRCLLMGSETSTQKLVSSTHAWIDAKKKRAEKKEAAS